MQSNPMRAALERGELQIGTWVNMVRNPAILTLLKAAGLDFARVDMEHTGADMQEIAQPGVAVAGTEFPDRRAPARGQSRVDHAIAGCRRVEPALPAGGERRARRGDRCGVAVCAARTAGQCRVIVRGPTTT